MVARTDAELAVLAVLEAMTIARERDGKVSFSQRWVRSTLHHSHLNLRLKDVTPFVPRKRKKR